jgi:hypothetical protein
MAYFPNAMQERMMIQQIRQTDAIGKDVDGAHSDKQVTQFVMLVESSHFVAVVGIGIGILIIQGKWGLDKKLVKTVKVGNNRAV